MKDIEKVVIPIIVIMLITMLGIYYISKEYKEQQNAKRAEEIKEEIESNPVADEDLEYEIIAMLVGKDEEDQKLKFMSVDNDRLFELEYSNSTPIFGKHGNYLTLEQIPLGEVLDVTYSVHSRKLKQLKISDEAWTFTDVTKFSINEEEKRMDIAGSTYKLPKTAIVSYKDELASFMDVTDVDTLIVKGYGRKICSIIVDRGHGYIRLQNDSYFEGGWIEIGQEIIKPVTEEMLIPVPEGNYHVRLTNRGYAAEEDVTVERDRESLIDLSKVNIKEVAIGHVAFTIIPDYAQLYIDGEITDYEDRVPLEFGIHKVHVELAGYKGVDTNIRVSDQYVNVDITLEKDGGDTSKTSTTGGTSRTTPTPTPSATPSAIPTTTNAVYPALAPAAPAQFATSSSSTSTTSTTSSTSSSSTTSTTNPTDVISNTKKAFIECPEEAEVFVDGIYVGITPVLFAKPNPGSHVVTLSRNGYVTKSYTVSVPDDNNDVTFSFSDLVKDEKQDKDKDKDKEKDHDHDDEDDDDDDDDDDE